MSRSKTRRIAWRATFACTGCHVRWDSPISAWSEPESYRRGKDAARQRGWDIGEVNLCPECAAALRRVRGAA